jgi:hypothetical protein
LQMMMGWMGILDPTGVVDAVNAGVYLLRGKKEEAAVSAIGAIPLLGKFGKLGKLFARGAGKAVAEEAKIAGKVESTAGKYGSPKLTGPEFPNPSRGPSPNVPGVPGPAPSKPPIGSEPNIPPRVPAKDPTGPPKPVKGNGGSSSTPGGRKSCFPAGTPVHTAFGLKTIEHIAPGDRVWAYDHQQLCWAEREVVEVYQLVHQGTMATIRVKGESLRATGGHPFWVVRGEGLVGRPSPVRIRAYEVDGQQEGRWVLARDLRAGDEVLQRHGEVVVLEAVRLDEVGERVYNFHVAELQNYAVGVCGVLVHNTNDPPAPNPSRPTEAARIRKRGRNESLEQYRKYLEEQRGAWRSIADDETQLQGWRDVASEEARKWQDEINEIAREMRRRRGLR